MIEQKITHCIVIMPRPLVYWYTRGFVYHHKIHILIDNVQLPRHRRDAGRPLRVGQPHREGLARPGDKPGVYPLAVQQNPVLQPLDPPDDRAGQVQVLAQEGVHPDARQLRRDRQFQPPDHHTFRESSHLEAAKETE